MNLNWFVPLLAAAIPSASCTPSSQAAEIDVATEAAATPSPQRTDISVKLAAWYECEECSDDELADLLALAKVTRYRVLITDNLSAALRQGPSATRRKQAEVHYQQRWQRMADAGQRDPRVAPRTDRQVFVANAVAQLMKLYRVRAAIALGRLGDGRARQVLEQFADDDDADVRRVIADVLTRRPR